MRRTKEQKRSAPNQQLRVNPTREELIPAGKNCYDDSFTTILNRAQFFSGSTAQSQPAYV